MTITYVINNKLYLNITNKCNCACVFCVRGLGDGIDGSGSLWLPHEPVLEEVIADIKKHNILEYSEIVFCGYGEPTENLSVLLETCRFIKREYPGTRIRLNTNGLADLSHGQPVAPLLAGLVDTVSISLNAPSKERYAELSKPVYGEAAFDALLSFAKDAKVYVPHVMFTVVSILTEEEVEKCKSLAAGLGVPLRVRGKIQ